MHNSNLEDALFSEADLIGATLSNACLRKANLMWTVCIGADLTKADLTKAELGLAVFLKAKLQEADLREADLRGANLREAALIGANLSAADLYGAIDLTWEQIEWAIGDEETKLPEYLVDHRPQAWSKGTEEQMEELISKVKIKRLVEQAKQQVLLRRQSPEVE